MDNESMKKSLFAVGLPAIVMQTTLPKEGQHGLRESVRARAAAGVEGNGYALYPENATAATKARVVFHTLAKECFLSRIPVYVVSLSRMLDALTTDDYPNTSEGMAAAQMLFITDFYEQGAPSPFGGNDGARFRAYIKSIVEAGRTVSVLADKPLQACKDWYPASFLEFVASHTDSFSITKGAV